MPELSQRDLDLITRTVIGEAGNQPADGQAGVAHVILNRLKSGKWGDSPSGVVLAPKQFETWAARPAELLNISRNSPAYKNAMEIVQGSASGNIEDPTNGAMNYANVDIVRDRGNNSALNWINGMSNVTRIGDHTFGNAEGQRAINKAANISQGEPMQAVAFNDPDVEETMRLFGLKQKGPSKSKSEPTEDQDIQETMKAFGIKPKDKNQVESVPLPIPRPASAPQATVESPMRGGVDLQNQIVSGMPIISPLFDRAVAATGAAISPLLPNSEKRPDSFGGRYSKNLEDLRAENKAYGEQNPVKSTLANLVGGGMALGPVAGSKIGRMALGIEGPSVGSRLLQGGVGGAVLGGTDAALRGEDPMVGGTIGGVVGAGAPAIASGVRGATKIAAENLWPRQGPLKDVGNNALGKLVSGLEGETPASIAAAKERMGSAGFLGDLNPGLTDIAGGIADTTGGPGKGIIREAYRTRAATQADRIDNALTGTIGPKTDIQSFKNFWTEARKAASDPVYQQFRDTSVNPTDELKALIPRLEHAGAFDQAEKISGISGEPINKKFFTTGTQKEYPTAQSWDYVKRGLDSKIDQAYAGGDKTTARALVSLKNEMIGEIEKTNAGQIWKQARTEFADRSSILDQIESGRDTFLGGRSGLSVDELREELKGLKGPELAARVTGLRSAADQVMGESMNGDTALRNKFLAPNNQEKIKLLIGDKKGDQLIKSMKQEKYLSDQDQNVRGGSQTTPKAERVKALQPTPLPEYNPNLTQPLSLIPPHILEQIRPSNIIDAWRGRSYARAHEQLAPLLTTKGPELQDLINSLYAEQSKRAAIGGRSNNAGNALASIVAVPGVTTARRQLENR